MGAVIARPPLPSGPFLVVGLARSGVAAAEALAARGDGVVGTDARTIDGDVKARLAAAGVEVRDGQEGADLLAGVATVVKSPGVPREAPVIAAALAAGVRVIGELELGWRLLDNEFLALTGSNGKTTTVELIGHVHRGAGCRSWWPGTSGRRWRPCRGRSSRARWWCAKRPRSSSRTLEAFAPDAAVLLNLAEDHLDRHGTFAAYRAAKLEIFARQPPGTLAVVPAALALEDAGGAAQRVTFGEPAGRPRDRDGTLSGDGSR